MENRKRTGLNEKSFSEKLSLKESSAYLSTENQIHEGFCCADKPEKNTNLGTDKKFSFSKSPVVGSPNVVASKEIPCSFSGNAVDNLNSAIAKVRNLQLLPSVCIYTLIPKGRQGVSAVDIDQNKSDIAYSPADSCEIYLLTEDDHSIFSGNVNDVWSKYVTTKKLQSKRRMTESSSSPQVYIIRHAAAVTCLCFTPDSNFLLSSSLDGSVKVFSTNSYRVVECYGGFGYFSDIDVSSDSTHFATTSILSQHAKYGCKSIASLYIFENTEPVMNFLGHKDAIKCVRFHPNGLYIATASCDKTIKLWSTRTSKEVRNFHDGCFEGHPEKLAFSPDGKYLASSYCGYVKIWDLASGKKLRCLETSDLEPNVLNICYNASADVLATGGSNKRIRLWNVKSDGSSVVKPGFDLLKCESLDKRIYSIKYTSNFFSCVTV